MTFVTLKIQPVSLDQVIQLDISAPQLVAFSFHGILLLFALVLHSQNETFAPATSAVEMVDKMAGLCLVISLTALITSIARKSGSNVHDTELPSDRRVLAHTTTTRRGRVMIPYRIIMVMFTIASLVLEVCPVGEMVRTAFSPLSFAAASFHIWVTMEEESLGGPVVLHYLAELGRAVFRCVIALLGGDLPRAVIMCVFAVVVFPVFLQPWYDFEPPYAPAAMFLPQTVQQPLSWRFGVSSQLLFTSVQTHWVSRLNKWNCLIPNYRRHRCTLLL